MLIASGGVLNAYSSRGEKRRLLIVVKLLTNMWARSAHQACDNIASGLLNTR
jgi:hypothetical protein